MTKHRIQLDKKDYLRALLTDTAPGDVPIIFSNDGFYLNAQRVEALSVTPAPTDTRLSKIVQHIYRKIVQPPNAGQRLVGKQVRYTVPHHYRIWKKTGDTRRLALLHPHSQLSWALFYRDFYSAITWQCSNSEFSIRAPISVSSSFFAKERDPTRQYKEIDIDTLDEQIWSRHASSYFAYNKYSRLHKFFDSEQFIELEKKYPLLYTLDVMRCFYTIYSHSISWALKTKKFAKFHKQFKNQIGSQLDQLMQRSNYLETNGIPVGNEVSRIFAEMIFQHLDKQVLTAVLEKHGFNHGEQYSVVRFMDDYFLFAEDDATAKKVTEAIKNKLNDFNLHIGETKSRRFERPFLINRPRVFAIKAIQDIEGKLFRESDSDQGFGGAPNLEPKHLKGRRTAVTKNLIDQIRIAASQSGEGYSSIANLCQAAFSHRIIRLIESTRKRIKWIDDDTLEYAVRDVICVYLDLMFFLHFVSPRPESSTKISKTILIVDEFFGRSFNASQPYIRAEIIRNVAKFIEHHKSPVVDDKYIALETLNIIIATADFGASHAMPSSWFSDWLSKEEQLSYFHLVAFIYYFQDKSDYGELVKSLEKVIARRLSDKNMHDLETDSELAHLFLDTITCPYLSEALRCRLLESFYKAFPMSSDPVSAEQITADISRLESTYWFVKWKALNLRKLLERKELRSVY